MGSVVAIDGECLDREAIVPKNSDDWYRLTKVRQHLLVSEWSQLIDIPLTILAPSAIYDANAEASSTNIGTLESIVSKLKLAPNIKERKSLTAMDLIVEAINTPIFEEGPSNHEKYLVIERPLQTATKICQDKFNAQVVVRVLFLKNLLLLFPSILENFGLKQKIPLTRERILKLYKSTNYLTDKDDGDWENEKFKLN